MALSVIKEMAIRGARIPQAASLAWGLPSFATPPPIRKAVARALDEDPDVGKYTLPDGAAELRRLIVARHLAETGIEVDPDLQVLVTSGNMQGMSTVLHTLLDPGDEVIVTDPGFPSHVQQIELAGGRPRYWPLRAEAGWSLDLDALPGLITPRTRAVVLVTPANPTGMIFAREELLAIADLARQHDILIVIDDPYSMMLYENAATYFNLASVAALAPNLCYLFTFSKGYAMSGWRVGYLIAPAPFKEQAVKVHDANLICAPHVSQCAAIAALSMPVSPATEFVEILARRRALMCERLDAVPHVFRYTRPQGAYYVFPRIVAPHRDARSFALDLLDTAGVVVTPGDGFGPAGEHHVRLAFCVSEETITRAFDRIEQRYPRRGRAG
jgi:aspartate/methionine/tyrosine aminotransferase